MLFSPFYTRHVYGNKRKAKNLSMEKNVCNVSIPTGLSIIHSDTTYSHCQFPCPFMYALAPFLAIFRLTAVVFVRLAIVVVCQIYIYIYALPNEMANLVLFFCMKSGSVEANVFLFAYGQACVS